jgi:cysteine desulfurase NifS/selenium donor protein
MSESEVIYLDHNATTPPAPEVVEAMIPALRDAWGNPSSTHPQGVRARQAVETARRQVADLLGCHPEEVIFTSGGTESDNAALVGVAEATTGRGRHLVTSSVEHPAVEEACRYLESRGWTVTRVGVDSRGRVDPREVEAALGPETVLVTVMHANNETGVMQPIEEIAGLARARGVLVHTDAAQSVGKIPVRVDDLGVDLLTLAGHKLYAPKGVGVLYLRRGTPFAGFLRGAAHEGGRRAGTENVPEIVGLGVACALADAEADVRPARLGALRDRLEERLRDRFPDLVVHGAGAERLPNTSSAAIPGADANALLAELEGVAASAGAACHAGGTEPSHVLTAMGVAPEVALCTLRLTVGRSTTPADVDSAAGKIGAIAERLRGGGGAETDRGAETGEIRLTRYTHGLGCACKLRPARLEEMLREVPLPTDDRVAIGTSTADDAGVWRLGDGRVLVATADFFTPVVDDPFDFGRIAAANAMSDVYAMGAAPWFALNLVGFPEARLPISVMRTILEGGAAVCTRARVAVIGGHTIEDAEPKYGLCVVGGAESEEEVWSNAGARPGDTLVLTKPLGTGLLSTAIKRGVASGRDARAAVESMAALNAAAALAGRESGGIHACTDVTGFGFVGHLAEMTRASGVEAEVEARAVPVLAGAPEAVSLGAVPGGTLGNREYLERRGDVAWRDGVDETSRLILCDAQTSGGLLFAVDPARASRLVSALEAGEAGCAAVVGRVTSAGSGRIQVV